MADPEQDNDQTLARLRERILRFAASRLAGDVAEDVTQEVLMVLHRKYASVTELAELVPLSLEIAHFKIWAARRKSARRGEHAQVPVEDVPLASSNPDPLEQAERRERLDRLERALKQLGDRCRQLLRLKLAGHSFPEIQKIMKADALNTVYTWDFRCRKQLAEKLYV